MFEQTHLEAVGLDQCYTRWFIITALTKTQGNSVFRLLLQLPTQLSSHHKVIRSLQTINERIVCFTHKQLQTKPAGMERNHDSVLKSLVLYDLVS